MKTTGIAIIYMGLNDYEKYCEQLESFWASLERNEREVKIEGKNTCFYPQLSLH